jgi:hypothetical protein
LKKLSSMGLITLSMSIIYIVAGLIASQLINNFMPIKYNWIISRNYTSLLSDKTITT